MHRLPAELESRFAATAGMNRRASPAALRRSVAGETYGARDSPRAEPVRVNRSKAVAIDEA